MIVCDICKDSLRSHSIHEVDDGVVEKDYMIPEAMTSPPDSTGGGDMAG